jgi:hypothetical protein
MAKVETEVNRSEAIRGVYKELPDAKAKEIVAHLKAKGIEVTEGLVYQVKKKMPRKPGKITQTKAAVPAPTNIATPSSNGALLHPSKSALGVGASIAVAKAAAEKVGGWANLKEIVDALQ